MKTCWVCHRTLPITDFYKSNTRHDGHQSKCKECQRRDDKIYLRSDEVRTWARYTIASHKKCGYKVEFSVTELVEFLNGDTHCKICGKKLDFSVGTKNSGVKHYSPSLDRVDNAGVLTLENIQLLCQECNRTKGNKTMRDFINYCSMVAEKFGDD
jgi:5-methylcytosine-specific restriction endonuclease McrA